MPPKYKRKRLWVDPPFQFRLLVRAAGYMLAYVFILWHISFFIELLVSMATDEPIGNSGQILIPVDQEMQELVETGENRRDCKSKAQNEISLAGRRVRKGFRMSR